MDHNQQQQQQHMAYQPPPSSSPPNNKAGNAFYVSNDPSQRQLHQHQHHQQQQQPGDLSHSFSGVDSLRGVSQLGHGDMGDLSAYATMQSGGMGGQGSIDDSLASFHDPNNSLANLNMDDTLRAFGLMDDEPSATNFQDASQQRHSSVGDAFNFPQQPPVPRRFTMPTHDQLSSFASLNSSSDDSSGSSGGDAGILAALGLTGRASGNQPGATHSMGANFINDHFGGGATAGSSTNNSLATAAFDDGEQLGAGPPGAGGKRRRMKGSALNTADQAQAHAQQMDGAHSYFPALAGASGEESSGSAGAGMGGQSFGHSGASQQMPPSRAQQQREDGSAYSHLAQHQHVPSNQGSSLAGPSRGGPESTPPIDSRALEAAAESSLRRASFENHRGTAPTFTSTTQSSGSHSHQRTASDMALGQSQSSEKQPQESVPGRPDVSKMLARLQHQVEKREDLAGGAKVDIPGDQASSPHDKPPMSAAAAAATPAPPAMNNLTEFTRRKGWSTRVVEEFVDFVHVLDISGRFLFASASVRKLTGWKAEELKGRKIWEFIHPEDVPAARAEFVRLRETPGGELLTYYRFRRRPRGGLRVPLHEEVQPLLKDDDPSDEAGKQSGSGSGSGSGSQAKIRVGGSGDRSPSGSANDTPASVEVETRSATSGTISANEGSTSTGPSTGDPDFASLQNTAKAQRSASGKAPQRLRQEDDPEKDYVVFEATGHAYFAPEGMQLPVSHNPDSDGAETAALTELTKRRSFGAGDPVARVQAQGAQAQQQQHASGSDPSSNASDSASPDPSIPLAQCFFCSSRVYPSKNVSMLDSFLELKVENERLKKMVEQMNGLAQKVAAASAVAGEGASDEKLPESGSSFRVRSGIATVTSGDSSPQPDGPIAYHPDQLHQELEDILSGGAGMGSKRWSGASFDDVLRPPYSHSRHPTGSKATNEEGSQSLKQSMGTAAVDADQVGVGDMGNVVRAASSGDATKNASDFLAYSTPAGLADRGAASSKGGSHAGADPSTARRRLHHASAAPESGTDNTSSAEGPAPKASEQSKSGKRAQKAFENGFQQGKAAANAVSAGGKAKGGEEGTSTSTSDAISSAGTITDGPASHPSLHRNMSSVMSLASSGDVDEDGKKKKSKKAKALEEDYVCTDCGRIDSPEWRKGPLGPKTLCNACGLRWAKKVKTEQDEAAGAPPAPTRKKSKKGSIGGGNPLDNIVTTSGIVGPGVITGASPTTRNIFPYSHGLPQQSANSQPSPAYVPDSRYKYNFSGHPVVDTDLGGMGSIGGVGNLSGGAADGAEMANASQMSSHQQNLQQQAQLQQSQDREMEALRDFQHAQAMEDMQKRRYFQGMGSFGGDGGGGGGSWN